MLAADKLQLQSALKQQATALKEKEFQLHHSNLMTVGTQAAVLASLDVTMFIEFQPPHDREWGEGGHAYLIPRTLKFVYYCLITTAFCCNLVVVAQTTLLSVLGTALALRGPDGSMITATDGLYQERRSIFDTFWIGLATTIGSALACVWLILSPEAALVCMSIVAASGFKLYNFYLRISSNFKFDESETVDFTDIFEGPAAIRVLPNTVVAGGGAAGSRSGGLASANSSRHGGGGGGGGGRLYGEDALMIDPESDSSMEGLMNGGYYNNPHAGGEALEGGGSTHSSARRGRGGVASGNTEMIRIRGGNRAGDTTPHDKHTKKKRHGTRSVSPLMTV